MELRFQELSHDDFFSPPKNIKNWIEYKEWTLKRSNLLQQWQQCLYCLDTVMFTWQKHQVTFQAPASRALFIEVFMTCCGNKGALTEENFGTLGRHERWSASLVTQSGMRCIFFYNIHSSAFLWTLPTLCFLGATNSKSGKSFCPKCFTVASCNGKEAFLCYSLYSALVFSHSYLST